MRQPPPFSDCLGYPITSAVIGLSIAATIGWWQGSNIEPFMMPLSDWWRQPWRLATPVLFHGNAIHLIFNLYWFWLFGTMFEARFGSGRLLAICLLLAIGSGTAEFALFRGGVGLSGVVYGLFGLLWVLGKNDLYFRDAVDQQTVHLMVGWFFLCIALTVTDTMRVANVAHGMGCVLGALLGWSMTAIGRTQRIRNAAVLAIVFLACIVCGTVARPYVNLSKGIGSDLAYLGYKALKDGSPQRAVELYERALKIDPSEPNWWHNLAIAYQRLGRKAEASDAFGRADSLKAAEANVESE